MFEEFKKYDFIINNENETLGASTLQKYVQVNVTPNQLHQIVYIRDKIVTQLKQSV